MNNDAMHGIAFTAFVTVASQALILRDRLLGRVKRISLDQYQELKASRRTIVSGGNDFFDASLRRSPSRSQCARRLFFVMG